MTKPKHVPECFNGRQRSGGLPCICDRLRACEQRVLDAARQAVKSEWTIDPSWDGTNWNNALHAATEAIDALRKEQA